MSMISIVAIRLVELLLAIFVHKKVAFFFFFFPPPVEAQESVLVVVVVVLVKCLVLIRG